jgi:hypothetical protein
MSDWVGAGLSSSCEYGADGKPTRASPNRVEIPRGCGSGYVSAGTGIFLKLQPAESGHLLAV